MNQEIIEMLKVLADKFGTTTEHLWRVLLEQALLSGITNVILLVVILVLTVMWVRFALERIKKEEENGYYSSDDDNIGALWLTIILVIPFCGVVSVLLIYDIVTAILNPDYWALREILRKY